MIKKSTTAALMLSGFLFASQSLFAQNNAAQTAQPVASPESPASIDQEIAMLRSDLRSNRKQVIAANMKLTDTEAEKFWPIYEQYVNELVKINNAKYALIKEYMQAPNMTEEQADTLAKRWGRRGCICRPTPAQIHPHIPKGAVGQRYGDVLSTRPARSNDDRPSTGKFHSADSALARRVEEG